MTCLLCRYFVPTTPEQQAAPYKPFDMRYDVYAPRIAEEVRREGRGQPGICTRAPVHLPVHTNHSCGEIVPREPLQNVLREKYDVMVWGHWRDRQNKELQQEIANLKDLLRASRKLSASRLRRLQAAP